MKKVFGKNQIIITTLALMIAVAGYLNYSGRLFGVSNKEDASSEVANQELLDISDEDIAASADTQDGDIESTEGESQETEGTPGEAVLTSSGSGTTIAAAKVSREQVRAQNKETLQELVDNQNITEEQRKAAVNQMLNMTTLAETEVTIETLLEAKGFSDSVVTLTDDGAEIVVARNELTDTNRAQIEDIVKRKGKIKAENIVITPVAATK